MWPIIIKVVLASIIPILVFKWRTRSEVVLKQKSPFIIDLYVSLNKFYTEIRKISAVLVTKSQEEMWDEFYNAHKDLMPPVLDNEAKAKLYLHTSTILQLEDFIDTSYEIIREKQRHEFMLANRGSFTTDDITDAYENWAKKLPKKLEEDFKYKLTPSLKVELNGCWDYIWLKRNLML